MKVFLINLLERRGCLFNKAIDNVGESTIIFQEVRGWHTTKNGLKTNSGV